MPTSEIDDIFSGKTSIKVSKGDPQIGGDSAPKSKKKKKKQSKLEPAVETQSPEKPSKKRKRDEPATVVDSSGTSKRQKVAHPTLKTSKKGKYDGIGKLKDSRGSASRK